MIYDVFDRWHSGPIPACSDPAQAHCLPDPASTEHTQPSPTAAAKHFGGETAAWKSVYSPIELRHQNRLNPLQTTRPGAAVPYKGWAALQGPDSLPWMPGTTPITAESGLSRMRPRESVSV